MSTDATSPTADDLELLRRPLHGFPSLPGPQPAHPGPVRFEATEEGAMALSTDPDSLKVRRLRRDPATVCRFVS